MKAVKYLVITVLGSGFIYPVSGVSNPYDGDYPTGQFPPTTQPSYTPYPAQRYPAAPARPAYPSQRYAAPTQPAYPSQRYATPAQPTYPSQRYTTPAQPAYPSQRYATPAQPAYNRSTPPVRQMPYGYGSNSNSQPLLQQPPAYGQQNPYQQPPRQMNYKTPDYQLSKMTPFGNSFSPNSLFSNNSNSFPTPWTNSGQWNPWKNGNNSNMPFFPAQSHSNEKKAWGDERHIWPDFYTDFTGEVWDQGSNSPYDMGRMPGGWRAPSLSSPDPVTVSDAVMNQFPPIMEEMGNMLDFAN